MSTEQEAADHPVGECPTCGGEGPQHAECETCNDGSEYL